MTNEKYFLLPAGKQCLEIKCLFHVVQKRPFGAMGNSSIGLGVDVVYSRLILLTGKKKTMSFSWGWLGCGDGRGGVREEVMKP